MIEAVNSVLSNAPFTRVAVQQQSVTNSFAANPDRVQQASLQAPYISLYIKVDTNFDKAVLQIRDNDTGDVVRQIPTESQLEAYRRAQASNAVRPAKAESNPVSQPEGGETITDVVDVPEPANVPEPARTATPVAAEPSTQSSPAPIASPSPQPSTPSVNTTA